MSEIDVAVWGSTGFAGQELVGILNEHPNVANIRLVGRELPDDLEASEVALLALPHGVSAAVASEIDRGGNTIIDLSGDLRFPTEEEYSRWYDQEHPAPGLLPAPYALPELFREDIPGQQILSVPGCYPTATLLGAVPLIDQGLIKPESEIDIYADSGVSGRGKEPTQLTHFMTMSGNAKLYNTGRVHRHVGEIERFLGGRVVSVFSPKVIPVERGMLVQTKLELNEGVTADDVAEVYNHAYSEEPLVKVLEEGQLPDIHSTVRTDGCYIGFVMLKRHVLVVSSIDNLRKGAASQAVQVFNLSQDLPELTGLKAL